VIDDAVGDFKAGYSPPPVFFYCSRNTAEPTRSNPTTILASLTRQLSHLQSGSPLLEPTVSLYNQKEEEAFASGSLRLKEIRTLTIQLAEYYPLVTIIIDALDECDPDNREDLVDTLETILQESTTLIKVFISSRDDQDIVFRLKQYPNLEISCNRNSKDLNNFIQHKTKELIRKRKLLKYTQSRERMETFIVNGIAKKAAGM
jgi:hypothetical protein